MDGLFEYIDSLAVVSTHEHHLRLPLGEPASLEFLLSHSYVGWCHPDLGAGSDRRRVLESLGGNSYFVWYEKALNDLFDFGGELTASNWDRVSQQVQAAYRSPEFHEQIFRGRCRYVRAIQDSYWQPGDDNARPDLYAPTFRINSFLYGYHLDAQDHNGNNAQRLYGTCGDFDEYLARMDSVIGRMKGRGCVALKSALAYDRGLDFEPSDKAAAARVFGRPPGEVTPAEEKVFGDYVFDTLCALAARHELPVQNHTGMGKLAGSDPLKLIPMIERHPGTKFVLFHGGYPWTDHVAALLHNYPNVYADCCWLPTVCTSAAERALHDFIETAPSADRITWGGDCWLATESYGQLLAMRHVLKKVLADKVGGGYFSEGRARLFAEKILLTNAKALYRI